jgi:hypothetical protein
MALEVGEYYSIPLTEVFGVIKPHAVVDSEPVEHDNRQIPSIILPGRIIYIMYSETVKLSVWHGCSLPANQSFLHEGNIGLCFQGATAKNHAPCL